MAKRQYSQGRYNLKNPAKYAGDKNNVIYRSGLELRFFKFFDKNPDIIQWVSEEFIIPYLSPVDNKMHRYFVDVVIKNKSNQVFMVEIKPDSQTRPPKQGKRKSKTVLIEEHLTYAINSAKWNAATEFCNKKGWEFTTMTEKDLGHYK